jgi:hypothetical protein
MSTLTLDERLISITAADLQWPFDGAGPHWMTRPRHAYPRSQKVDPFPCYPHDRHEVRSWALRTEERFPIPTPPTWYVTEHECTGRTNGYADSDGYTVDKGDKYEQRIEPFIVLVGKRIPLHPAMTRYLIGHEYGHVVHYHLERKFRDEENHVFERAYAEMRGIEFFEGYGGGRWHLNTGEIIANDFRILVADIAPDFWPHAVAHPLKCPRVKDWWRQQQAIALRDAGSPLAAALADALPQTP